MSGIALPPSETNIFRIVAAIRSLSLFVRGNTRERLAASRTYYVDDILGNDSNAGLAAGANAFKTLNAAVAAIQALDLGGHAVTVNVAAPASSYAGMSLLEPWVGEGSVTFTGNTTTPTNVPIAGGASAAIDVENGCKIIVQGFSLTGLFGIEALFGAYVTLGKMDFGAATAVQCYSNRGSYVEFTNTTTVHGNSTNFVQASHRSEIRFSAATVTWTGNSTYSIATLYTDNAEIVGTASASLANAAGTVTGQRFAAINGGMIQWNGNAPPAQADIPGTIDGTYPRVPLFAAATYYVRTNGSDSNTGLANTAGGAFLTKQKAMDVIAGSLDLGGQTVTVQVADGTYTGGLQIKPWIGAGVVQFQGNASTPANVLVSTTGANAIDASFGPLPGIFRLKDMKLKCTTLGFPIVSRSPGRLQYTNIVFDTAPLAHVVAATQGVIEPYGNNSIVGAASVSHFLSDRMGMIDVTARDLPSAIGTYTVSGGLTFGQFAFAATQSAMVLPGITFAGAGAGAVTTGLTFAVTGSAIISVEGAGDFYLPGNAAGVRLGGGQYS